MILEVGENNGFFFKVFTSTVRKQKVEEQLTTFSEFSLYSFTLRGLKKFVNVVTESLYLQNHRKGEVLTYF